MPQASSRAAVIVSGGKQYLVSEGDRILVQRLRSAPGAEVQVDSVLLVRDGDDVNMGSAASATPVTVRVIGHERGPKVMAFRYKSKKRVRVHRGSRAELTAIEIVSVGAEKAAARSSRSKAAKAPEPAAAESRTAAAAGKPSRPARRARKTRPEGDSADGA